MQPEKRAKQEAGEGRGRLRGGPALELVVGHIVATLPDSLTQREDLLEALAAAAPRGHRSGPLLRQL